LGGPVGIVERVAVRGFGVLAPVRILAAHHVPAIDLLVLEGYLAVLELPVDAAVEKPSVSRALDPHRVLSVNVRRGEYRRPEIGGEFHAEMGVAQLAWAGLGGVGHALVLAAAVCESVDVFQLDVRHLSHSLHSGNTSSPFFNTRTIRPSRLISTRSTSAPAFRAARSARVRSVSLNVAGP